MAEYTLTFDSQVPGWVSFYSFKPEQILGMNNYLYTFKNGNLWQHNVNDQRNVFYGITDPALGAKSTITSDLKLYGLATLFYISIGPLKLVLGA